jgi:hypothetical protein
VCLTNTRTHQAEAALHVRWAYEGREIILYWTNLAGRHVIQCISSLGNCLSAGLDTSVAVVEAIHERLRFSLATLPFLLNPSRTHQPRKKLLQIRDHVLFMEYEHQ